jgi:uncharacterized repeat protein (TIGR02543 family)
MTEARTLSATFSINSYNLLLTTGDGGSVSGAGTFSFGTKANITATPNTGYSFTGWVGEGVVNPSSKTTQVQMNEDRNISASFSINSYDLNLTAGDGGSVSGAGSFSYGYATTITATPNTGYSFTGWIGEGVVNPSSKTTQVQMNEDRNISASFSINSYDLNLTAGDGGSVSEGGTFSFGTEANIIATPNSGYSFVQWTGEGIENPNSSSTFVSMTQNRSISAFFAVNSYDLSTSAGNGGRVSEGGSFTFGSSAAITATPSMGYSFAGWTGNGVSDPTSPSTTVIMTDDRNLTANFTPREIGRYLLIINSQPSSGGFTSGADEYEDQSNASISAQAVTGYSFSHWSGEEINNPSLSNTSIFMDQDRNITANFTINSYDLQLTAGDGGSVSGAGSFAYGYSTTITATPNVGYSFTGWMGEGVVNPLAEATQVRMTQDRNVSASFSINSYDLKLTAGDGGSVSEDGSFSYGTEANITASPNTGYSFTGWIGEGVVNPSSNTTQVRMTEDKYISASFSINSYDLQLTAGDGGSVSEDGSFSYGTEANITASPNSGYSFTGWMGEGIVNPSSNTTQVRMTEDRNISASFSINSYDLKLTAGDGGSVSEDGSFSYGTEANITASPNTGYSFTGWIGEGIVNPSSNTTQVRMTEDRNISASFSINSYLLLLSTDAKGSLSYSGSLLHGSYATITATPHSGYSFLSWIGEGVTGLFDSTSQVLMIQDRNISAHFTVSLSTGLELSPLGSNWYSSWLGVFYKSSEYWIYHTELGWLFLYFTETNFWLWTDNHGWAWTAQEPFSGNFLWLESVKEWVYLDLISTQTPRYYNYQLESWVDW